MAVVYSTDFTVGADTALGEFPSAGSPDFIAGFGGAYLTVSSAQGAVYPEVNSTDIHFPCIDAAVPTGDQEVTLVATVRGTGYTQCYALVRAVPNGGSSSCYSVQRSGPTTWQLWKLVNGVWGPETGGFPLAQYTVASTADGDTVTVKLKATGTNPVVITATINGVEQTPFNDSATNRVQSGYPGIGAWKEPSDAIPYGTSFSVDDLIATPVITGQPSNATQAEGKNAAFSVTATGATSYQWYDNSGGSFAAISGEVSDTLTLSAVTLAMNGRQYYVRAINGSGETQSNTVTLAVDQLAVPVSVTFNGAWSPNTGPSDFEAVDELDFSDIDFTQTFTGADFIEFALTAKSTPGTSGPRLVRYRLAGDGTSGVQVQLRQSTTVIATWTHDPAPGVFTTYEQTLDAGQVAAITDYGLLRLRFTEI